MDTTNVAGSPNGIADPTDGPVRGRDRRRLVAVLLATLAIGSLPAPSAASPDETHSAAAPAESRQPQPDHVALHIGGIAARIRTTDGVSLPGESYLVMATVGSAASARVFDATPFVHDGGQAADVAESNLQAAEAAAAITGSPISAIDLTSAPGGGASAGLVYWITYLDLVTDGAFTAGLRVAATGELADEGYLAPVRAADEKLGAAAAAGLDVVFTSTQPSHAALNRHAERHVGHIHRSRHGQVTLHNERALDQFERWGATQPQGLDVVMVGHIADVAAYLCGVGSEVACDLNQHLGVTITTDIETEFDRARRNAVAASTQIEQPTDGQPS